MQMYQIFGSENSLDLDVMFWVSEVPENIQAAKDLCKVLARDFQVKKGIAEKINANIAKVEDGKIVAIFKGIISESNNALFYTYSLHNQDFENQIKILLPRDIEEKLHRTLRVLLSFLTKTAQRSSVKLALQGDFSQKIKVLKEINLREYENEASLGYTNSLVDFQKTFAFQIGQTWALMEGKELFTKNEIAAYFPDLQAYLNRNEGISNEVLQKYLHLFIQKTLTKY